MEAVYILTVVDGLRDALFIDMARQRQLHDEAVYVFILVELVDTLEQLLLAHRVLEAYQRGLEPALFAGQHLILNVGFRTTVVAHEHRSEMRALAPCCTMLSTSLAISALMAAAVAFPSIICIVLIYI